MHEPVRIRELPDEYKISIDGDTITVWNDGNGSKYSVEDLAPFTDPDDTSGKPHPNGRPDDDG